MIEYCIRDPAATRATDPVTNLLRRAHLVLVMLAKMPATSEPHFPPSIT